ncbi:MAG: alpha-L-fucosidase [Abitibacteriaceae bacterium]|nr:alpha-L-fucosidase [Abditibacteriaceae bacterium]
MANAAETAPPAVTAATAIQDIETPAQRDARMKWWREAKFGMFIHWGVYSVPAGFYQGKEVPGIGEWIMNRGKIPVAEYRAFAKQYNPVKYNPEAWVELAKAAGMKYIVITSKHHDGFANFDSKASDWNIVKATPYGKDVLKPLAEACRRNGIKLGFYYSQAQDWNNPGGAAAGGHWDKAQDGDMDAYIKNVAVPQVKEILSNYGPISVLWWDTPVDMTKERAAQFIPLLKLQPGIIMNNRLGGGYRGDTETPEQFVPATGFPGRDWETCMTMNDTWGFKSNDNHWKSTESLIRNLVDIASKGGNYLLNVGPTSEGLIPQPSVERLQAIGQWMKVNGEAIYSTTASPFKHLAWGRCTKKIAGNNTTLYLHVFDWPKDGKLLVPGLKNAVTMADVLAANRREALATQSGPEGVMIMVPTTAPDPVSSTVVLEIKGAPQVEIAPLEQETNGSLTLLPNDAVLHGNDVKVESARGRDNIGYWTNAGDWIEWPFKVTKPGKFTVRAEVAATGSGSFELSVGDQKLHATAPNTGDYGKFKAVDLGTIEIPTAGKVSLMIKPVADGWQPFNLRSIQLKPVP